jgi:hypothetical protein
MKPGALLAGALFLAAPLRALPPGDSQAKEEESAARQEAAAVGGQSAPRAVEHAPDAGAPEGIGPAQDAEGGKDSSAKIIQKLQEQDRMDAEKMLLKARTPTNDKGGLSGGFVKTPTGAAEALQKASREGGGATPQASGGGKTPVAKQQVSDPSRIPSTASGRKTMKLMSRWGGALGTEYKTTETALPSGETPGPDKPSDKFAAASSAALKPRVMDDLSLAGLSGRSQALAAIGLKIRPGPDGKPRVLTRDGAPATPEQAQAAVRLLAEQPAALVRRPDFFQALPREHYDALRAAYAPEAPRFRDIGLQSRRDFQWTRSCSDVSGGCNPYSAESHYERGHDVSPETLETIYRARPPMSEPEVKPEAAADATADAEEPSGDLGDFDEDDEKLAEAARAAEGVDERRGLLGGVAARLRGLLSGLKLDGAGAWSGDARSEAAGSAVSAGTRAPGAAVPAPGPAAAAAAAASPGRGAAVEVPQSAPVPGNDAAPRRSWRGAGLLGLAAAALAAAAVLRRL